MLPLGLSLLCGNELKWLLNHCSCPSFSAKPFCAQPCLLSSQGILLSPWMQRSHSSLPCPKALPAVPSQIWRWKQAGWLTDWFLHCWVTAPTWLTWILCSWTGTKRKSDSLELLLALFFSHPSCPTSLFLSLKRDYAMKKPKYPENVQLPK